MGNAHLQSIPSVRFQKKLGTFFSWTSRPPIFGYLPINRGWGDAVGYAVSVVSHCEGLKYSTYLALIVWAFHTSFDTQVHSLLNRKRLLLFIELWTCPAFLTHPFFMDPVTTCLMERIIYYYPQWLSLPPTVKPNASLSTSFIYPYLATVYFICVVECTAR